MKTIKRNDSEYSLVREHRLGDDLDLIFVWKGKGLIEILYIRFRQFSNGTSEIVIERMLLTRGELNAVSEFMKNKESLTMAR